MHIPNRHINPTPAEIEKLKPVISNITIPPTAANGMFISTSPASRGLPNKTNRMMNHYCPVKVDK